MNNQQEQQQEYSMDSFVSPSFSSYTSDKLANIADQVNKDYFRGLEPQNDVVVDGTGFEFVAYGDVSPVFPIFNRDLMTTVFESDDRGESKSPRSSAEEDLNVMDIGSSMRKLLIRNDDRNRNRNSSSSSSSSSSSDDLEEIPAGTYCVWSPDNSAKSSPNRDKRSKSAGSSPPSKPWKLLDLIRRSNSEGKDSLVLVTPTATATSAKKKEAKGENSKKQRGLIMIVAGKHKVVPRTEAEAAAAAGVGEKKKVSAHEAFYVRNRELSKVDKRRSYLPYRQELIAFSSF